jgi:ketosteroid isomerase-like protein
VSDRRTDAERGSAEQACWRLVLESVRCNDARDWEGLVALYADDGVVERPSGERVVGHDAILASYSAGAPDRRTRHVCSNWTFALDDPTHARGRTSVVVYAWDVSTERDPRLGYRLDDRVLIGDFEDRFVLTDDGWRIAERRATTVAHS